MVNANEVTFELIMVDDIPAIFTNSRVSNDSVPKGLFCYDIRHDDLCRGIACEIKPFILVNHWGSIITKEKIPLENGSHYLADDLNYLGYPMRLDEFIRTDIGQMLSAEEDKPVESCQMNVS